MPAVGALVRCTDGSWMTRPPQSCPHGHRFRPGRGAIGARRGVSRSGDSPARDYARRSNGASRSGTAILSQLCPGRACWRRLTVGSASISSWASSSYSWNRPFADPLTVSSNLGPDWCVAHRAGTPMMQSSIVFTAQGMPTQRRALRRSRRTRPTPRSKTTAEPGSGSYRRADASGCGYDGPPRVSAIRGVC
jgi:hypothetical protein